MTEQISNSKQSQTFFMTACCSKDRWDINFTVCGAPVPCFKPSIEILPHVCWKMQHVCFQMARHQIFVLFQLCCWVLSLLSSVCLSLCLSLFASVPVFLTVRPSVRLSICLSLPLSISVYLSAASVLRYF